MSLTSLSPVSLINGSSIISKYFFFEMIKRDIKIHVMSVSMRKALIIWEEYIEAKSRNEALFLRSVSIKLRMHGPD